MIVVSKSKFKKNIIDINVSIRDSLRLLHNLENNIIFVTNKKKLFGSITDNDIRKIYLKLKNIDHENLSLTEIVNKKTFYFLKSDIKKFKKSVIEKKLNKFKYIPLLNHKKEITDVIITNERKHYFKDHNKVNAIIMAGGFGTRLRPLTYDTPKPAIVINKNSNLISLMNSINESNVENFYISTHYLPKLIKKEINLFWLKKNKINFYYEKKLLGTFGSVIAIIKKYKINEPLIVCNSDIYTNLNFSNLINYYFQNKCDFLVCSKILRNEVPYGVIKSNKNRNIIKSFEEKPVTFDLINAGIYMINPEKVIKFFPKIKRLSVVDVINKLLASKINCHIFPINEFWSDMGNHKDLDFLRKSGNS